tara:strand:- start:494 stop:673 length:180 start_codon:yes stop_codon:yes gene_type:complete
MSNSIMTAKEVIERYRQMDDETSRLYAQLQEALLLPLINRYLELLEKPTTQEQAMNPME